MHTPDLDLTVLDDASDKQCFKYLPNVLVHFGITFFFKWSVTYASESWIPSDNSALSKYPNNLWKYISLDRSSYLFWTTPRISLHLYLSSSGSANAQLPAFFRTWTFSLNIELNKLLWGSFMSCLHCANLLHVWHYQSAVWMMMLCPTVIAAHRQSLSIQGSFPLAKHQTASVFINCFTLLCHARDLSDSRCMTKSIGTSNCLC